MKILTIILLFVCGLLDAQDSIFFSTHTEAESFTDSIDIPNNYPRQDAWIFQQEGYDTIKSKYYHNINKVSEKGLVQSDSLWKPMMRATIGDTIWYDGLMYEVLQTHYTQSDWSPPNVPALFVLRPLGNCPEWVQPTGAHDAYAIGDCVTSDEDKYKSKIAANVYDPKLWNDEVYPQYPSWQYWDKEPFDE